MKRNLAPLLITLLLLPDAGRAGTALRSDMIVGPVKASLVSVIDGDTILVTAHPWPQHSISVMVRLRGIDAAEMRSNCSGTRDLAIRAKAILTAALGPQPDNLLLQDVSGDKYFGRVVANVRFGDGRDAAALLLASGLARPYDGGRKGRDICPHGNH
jgi:micrococcal nuclease